MRSEMDDDQEEVRRAIGSEDDEGEDLLEGAERCMPPHLLKSYASSYQDDAAPPACYAPTPSQGHRGLAPSPAFSGERPLEGGGLWPLMSGPRLRRDYRPMPHLDNYDQDDINDGELPEETFEQREAARLRAEAALDRADLRAGRVGARRRLPGALEGMLKNPRAANNVQSVQHSRRAPQRLLLAAERSGRCAQLL